MVELQDIANARERLAPWIRQTPLLKSPYLDQLSGTSLFFKAEHLQVTGAFKFRGATNAIAQLTENEKAKGVATHSSGNHGAALAKAASLFHVEASIVMPDNATRVKREAVLGYGGKVILCTPGLPAREETLQKLVASSGALIVPPYDDERVICGQGTLALEVMEELGQFDAMVTPVGGGGLLAGVSIALKNRRKTSRVYGAEPEMADDAYRSLRSGKRILSHKPHTIAEGLQTVLGERNFDIIRRYVDDILLVSESEIVDAMRLIWMRMKQIIEPSSAVTLAAVLRYPALFRNQKVVLVLTGGNVDLDDLPWMTK